MDEKAIKNLINECELKLIEVKEKALMERLQIEAAGYECIKEVIQAEGDNE